MECSEVTKFIYVYLDGEFDPRERADFEQHINDCSSCRSMLEVERSFHGLLRRRLDRPAAPPGLRDRILEEIARESRASDTVRARISRLPVAVKAFVPALAAAALLFVVLWPGRGGETIAPPEPAVSATEQADSLASVVDETIAVHESALPSEVGGDRDGVQRFVQKNVPFHVSPPAADTEHRKFIGARLAHLHGRPAVLYTYRIDGKRVTAAQFPERVDSPAGFERAAYVGNRGPYHINLVRDRAHGLTHSVVGDVGERQLNQLIPASYHP